MDNETLRGELERLFELEELTALSVDVLGLSADEIGGGGSKASFARALVEKCVAADCIEALFDAVEILKPEFDVKVRTVISRGLASREEFQNGAQFGPFLISRKLGDGPVGTTYIGKRDGRDVVLKILAPQFVRDRRAFARFQVAIRLGASLSHEGLPANSKIESIDDFQVLSYDHFEAQTLAARAARSGPMHINEARTLLRSILEALSVCHKKNTVHGNLKLENVLVARSAEAGKQRLVLVDSCLDRLRVLRRPTEGSLDLFVVVGASKYSAPEQLRGERIDTRTDVYAFGCLMYELLTGRLPFNAKPGIELAVSHLTAVPLEPSTAAPRGWVTREVADFILRMLSKDPASRPRDAEVVLEDLEKLGRTVATAKAEKQISDEQIAERIDALIVTPEDEAAAKSLDDAVELGADANKVAQAFVMAAEHFAVDDSEKKELRKSLLYRAARLYESTLKNHEEAEKVYTWIVETDPNDDLAAAALEETRKHLGKWDEVVEMLLGRIELSADAQDRAQSMAELGRIYEKELEDPGQAVVAYAQAFCEMPDRSEYADAVERMAGSNIEALGEAIATLAEATRGDLPSDAKNQIFLRLGNWYGSKLGRADAALPCYQAIMATNPSHEGALDAMAGLFRSSQQYAELGKVLLRRSDVVSTPARAREFRCEAAELLETRLNETSKAKELYEQILQADPGHVKASDALLRIYEKDGNKAGRIQIMERKSETLKGKERAEALVRIAELYETNLKEVNEAVRRYELALVFDEENQAALEALDGIYRKNKRFQELLLNLERQVAVAATPRTKIEFYEQIAKLNEDEFLEHTKAALALEAIVAIDPAHDGALLGLIRHYRALDRWEEVAAVYERQLKVVSDSARRLEILLALARVYSEQLASPERATKAYELTLEVDPHHGGALQALAHLREQSGDAEAALRAVDALAAKASSPREKAEHLMRAARLLEGRGDRDGAIERYKLVLDANPRETAASSALRASYIERGDVTAAIELIGREIEFAESGVSKGKLCAEAAKLAREKLRDNTRAEISAKEAIGHDPTQIEALAILGDLAFEADHPLEALHHYEAVVPRIDQLSKSWAIRTLQRFISSLARAGTTEKALSACELLKNMAPDDVDSYRLVGKVLFDHADPKEAFRHHQELLEKFSAKLVGSEKVEVLYRFGESARKAGDAMSAIKSLSDAADMDPAAAEPLTSLSKVHEAKGEWEEVIRVKNRRLDVASGDERVDLLVEIGEICATKLSDRTRAAKSFVAALEERPDDRKLLSRLMQLYSEGKDWSKLVEVVLKLADFVDDKKQKAKYIHTAAIVNAHQLSDIDKALEYFDKVLELDPSMDAALQEALTLRQEKGDFEGVERHLKFRLERATDTENRELILRTFDELGELYHKKLGWMGEAIDAYEAGQMLDPDGAVRNGLLAELYASNPTQYLEKAVASQRALLRINPNKAEPYKLLRRLYTDAKRADGAWCLCQALAVLNLAEADEERFYRRMRSETAAPARDRLTDEDWARGLMHEDADPIVTAILALIEPAVLATRADTLENLGYDIRYAIDLSLHPYPMSQTIHYAAGVLGMESPPTFQNINDDGGISFLHAQRPSIVLGRAAFEVEVPQQAAAFIVARHLTYYRPGLYIRHLIPTGTGLKAWLFAAIKMNSPQFPVSGDLEGPVEANLKALNEFLSGPMKERLASLVSKLLQSGRALDLKKWVAAIDLTADRAGLLISHDLEVAIEMIKASEEGASPVSHKDRLKEAVLFSISESYFAIRAKLGIAIDS